MIKVTEKGEIMEAMNVMEGLSDHQGLMLYKMYRFICEAQSVSDHPEGKEGDLMCGSMIKVLSTTPWMKEIVDMKGFILLGNEHYSLVGFPENASTETKILNFSTMGYAVFRNEDLEVIPEL